MEIINPTTVTQPDLERVSDRYQFLSTQAVIEMMADHGYQMADIQVSKTRSNNGAYATHLVTFEHPTTRDLVPGQQLRVIFRNDHGGRRSAAFVAGALTGACLNGHFFGDQWIPAVTIRHNDKGIMNKAEGAVINIAEQLPALAERIIGLQQLNLNHRQQAMLAEAMLKARYGNNLVTRNLHRLLQPRRWQDSGNNSAWKTYNIIQESLTRGVKGLIYYEIVVRDPDPGTHVWIRHCGVRAIKSPNTIIKMNRKWTEVLDQHTQIWEAA